MGKETFVPQPFGLSAALVRNWSSLSLNRRSELGVKSQVGTWGQIF